jgi:hypothetical protein
MYKNPLSRHGARNIAPTFCRSAGFQLDNPEMSMMGREAAETLAASSALGIYVLLGYASWAGPSAERFQAAEPENSFLYERMKSTANAFDVLHRNLVAQRSQVTR